MAEILHFYAPITKVSSTPEGHRIVTGVVSDETLDLDKQITDYDWFKKAATKWFANWANIREQHGSNAIGKGIDLQFDDTQRKAYLTSKVVDAGAVVKIDEGVLQGYSWGAKGARVVKDAAAPHGRIVDGELVETSLVDHPANESCKIVIATKSAKGVQVTDGLLGEGFTEDEVDEVNKLAEVENAKRDFSDKERQRMAGEGTAMPDGSFPIANEADLHNAIRAVGRAKDEAAAKAHIIARAKAMGMESALPDDWTKAVEADAAKDIQLQGEEAVHNDALNAAHDAIMSLIKQEADEDDCEYDDIAWLASIGSQLHSFADHEAQEDDDDAMEMALSPLADLVKAAGEPDATKRRVFYSREHREAIAQALQNLQMLVSGDAQGPAGADVSSVDAPEHLTEVELEQDGDSRVSEPKTVEQAGPTKTAEADEVKYVTAEDAKALFADLVKEAVDGLKDELAEKIAAVDEKVEQLGKSASPGGPRVAAAQPVEKTFTVNQTVDTQPSIEMLEKLERYERLSKSDNRELAASAAAAMKALRAEVFG